MSDREKELARLEAQARTFLPLEQKILKECGIRPEHRVLEVGCGPGFLTPTLCELASMGRVTACDTSAELLEICRGQSMPVPRNGFEAVLSTGAGLPVGSASQDFAYLRFVMQHVPDRLGLLRDVSRSLDEGGIICLLDSDDGLILQYPQDDFVAALVQDAQRIQSGKGGDRMVGRKVGSLLSQLGFRDVKRRILSFTTTEVPFASLARLLLGFKAELSGKREEVERWIGRMEPLASTGEYFLSAGVVLTTGIKAKRD